MSTHLCLSWETTLCLIILLRCPMVRLDFQSGACVKCFMQFIIDNAVPTTVTRMEVDSSSSRQGSLRILPPIPILGGSSREPRDKV